MMGVREREELKRSPDFQARIQGRRWSDSRRRRRGQSWAPAEEGELCWGAGCAVLGRDSPHKCLHPPAWALACQSTGGPALGLRAERCGQGGPCTGRRWSRATIPHFSLSPGKLSSARILIT